MVEANTSEQNPQQQVMLPKKCPLRCCRFNMVVQDPQDAGLSSEKRVLPLKEVFISAKAAGAMATIDVSLDYLNPYESSALEATYEFPLEKTMLVAKLEAEIDGRKVEA